VVLPKRGYQTGLSQSCAFLKGLKDKRMLTAFDATFAFAPPT